MSPAKFLFHFVAVIFLTAFVFHPLSSAGQPAPGIATSNSPAHFLGEAATAPKGDELKPHPKRGATAKAQSVTGGFGVNTDSREQTRAFYNGIYHTSDNVPEDSTADVVNNCFPGTNSTAFVEATLRRINWFRAMAGDPASVVYNPTYNEDCQQMAVMISASGLLNHTPPTTWPCYTADGRSVSGGNQAGGFNGPDAITGYVWDFGGNNSEVGHRRWILFPPEQIMGTGDVPASGTNIAGNSTYVFDPSINDPRPATRKPYVSWPPEGYAPYQVVFPYWSFGLSNADLSAATVTMKSNSVTVSVVIQPYQTGFGDNTLVWVPMGLDGTTEATTFPFNGTDTVYAVTVGNIVPNGTTNKISVSYSVTVFDPAVAGGDYVAPAVSGPAHPTVNAPNIFSSVPINNPNVTSYEWIVSQLSSGNLADNANNGLLNFAISPVPDYSIITNAPDGSGNCFHLCHDNATSQFLQLNELLFPATNTLLSFKSLVGYATSDESARVQASTNGGTTWSDLWVEIGCNSGQCESTFTPHSLSLSNYANIPTLLRFNWAFTGGSYYPESDSVVGWCLENFTVTNSLQLLGQTTNILQTTNLVSGNVLENANNDATNGLLVNFTFAPPADYQVITNAPDGSTNYCFHLCNDVGTPETIQLNEILVPATNTTVKFGSLLGFSTSDETARVQVSTNGGANWQDIFTQVGCDVNGSGPQCESSFTTRTLSLSNYANIPTLLRFKYDFTGGSFYPGQIAPYDGWCLENIVVTNAQQTTISSINTTNFTFTPTQAGAYLLQAVPVIFGQFPLDGGPALQVTAISPSGITMQTPVAASSQVQLNFTVTGGLTGTYKLLQTAQLGTAWTTNTSATFTTNVPGSSYRFTTAKASAKEFYRVLLVP